MTDVGLPQALLRTAKAWVNGDEVLILLLKYEKASLVGKASLVAEPLLYHLHHFSGVDGLF